MGLKIQRRKGPTHLHTAVISSVAGVTGIVLLIRAAWPFTNHTIVLAGAGLFLLLGAVAFYRVWKVYQVTYPVAAKGDVFVTQALNATITSHLYANCLFLLLALAVFQFSLLHK
jgi:hypothetical protein